MSKKYLTFSFDDCEIHDRRLCDLLRQYGMKATFFLISGQLGMKCPFYRYGEDTIVERVSPDELRQTYQGMEIAAHTAQHSCPVTDLQRTVFDSARYLELLCGDPVRGLAYPGGQYTQEHIHQLKESGTAYARTAEVTHDFAVPREWLAWDPTCKYDDDNIDQLVKEFLNYRGDDPAVFHIYGHSYELTRKEKNCCWDGFEATLRKLSFKKDIVYATNIEIYNQLTEGGKQYVSDF